MSRTAAALGTLGAALFSSALYAAKPTAADRAWIDTCISQRKSSKEGPARLRKYCVCMQQTVEDNQPFENVTALERTYPSAHDVLETHWEATARGMEWKALLMAILVKCNATEVVSEAPSFFSELPADESIQPAKGDEVFIWTSEHPRQGPNGQGLELRGDLVSWQRSGLIVKVEIWINDRLPEALLGMNDLADAGRKSAPAHRLHERIHKSRRPRIWALDEDEREFLEKVFKRQEQVEDNETIADITHIHEDVTINRTTRRALVDARLGQGRFRSELALRWGNACAVTGCKINSLLRASHIKPWRSSSNAERLDPANGFLLAAHLDALFDSGLISFEDDGQMLLTKCLPPEDAIHFHLPSALRLKLTTSEKAFLQYHRDNQFSADGFTFEANLNFMGLELAKSGKLPEWNEWQSFTKKLNKVFGALGIPIDLEKRPLASMQKMKDLRDTLAHGKPVFAEYDKVEIGTHEELEGKPDLLAGWEKDCTSDSVFEALADLDDLWKLMIEKSGLNLWDTMTSGEGGITFIEHVD